MEVILFDYGNLVSELKNEIFLQCLESSQLMLALTCKKEYESHKASIIRQWNLETFINQVSKNQFMYLEPNYQGKRVLFEYCLIYASGNPHVDLVQYLVRIDESYNDTDFFDTLSLAKCYAMYRNQWDNVSYMGLKLSFDFSDVMHTGYISHRAFCHVLDATMKPYQYESYVLHQCLYSFMLPECLEEIYYRITSYQFTLQMNMTFFDIMQYYDHYIKHLHVAGLKWFHSHFYLVEMREMYQSTLQRSSNILFLNISYEAVINRRKHHAGVNTAFLQLIKITPLTRDEYQGRLKELAQFFDKEFNLQLNTTSLCLSRK